MNIDNRYCLQIWIGLAKVHVDKKQADFKNWSNAYVNVLGLARGKADFRKKVKRALAQMNFTLRRLEDPETFARRISTYKIDQSLYRLAKDLLEDNDKIKFGTFHAYDLQ
jgi:hypothetical protein